MKKSSKLAPISLVVCLVVMAIGFDKAMTAPTEATMGNLYRVFFYHFPHTILSFLFPYLNCGASLLYLVWRKSNPERAAKADAFAIASCEITVLYTTIGLATGMLWGRAAWGIWWTWDARLTTYLLLWLLYVSYLLLRRMSHSTSTALLAAVLGIFAAVDIPICFESIRWWRTQHPAPVFGGGSDAGIDPSMYSAVWWNLIAFALWGAFLLGCRYALERRRQALDEASAYDLLDAQEVR
ncbi:cytochrome c biogenesis protein [Granulicella cerasi]|uniref:Heme exporter protein C n=1 Tax=Granulicella cerasi TaxID=741063 RepID=A0ABW1Z6T9_9BACT|nr:cytochrome c biogenesis protein [Granulicella cerasi]